MNDAFLALDSARFERRYLHAFRDRRPRERPAEWEEFVERALRFDETLSDAELDPEDSRVVSRIIFAASLEECEAGRFVPRELGTMQLIASGEVDLRGLSPDVLECWGLIASIAGTSTRERRSPDHPWWARPELMPQPENLGFTSPARLVKIARRLREVPALEHVTRRLCERDQRPFSTEEEFLMLGPFLEQAAGRGCWVVAWEWSV